MYNSVMPMDSLVKFVVSKTFLEFASKTAFSLTTEIDGTFSKLKKKTQPKIHINWLQRANSVQSKSLEAPRSQFDLKIHNTQPFQAKMFPIAAY